MAPRKEGGGDLKQRNRGAAITRRFSGQLEGVAQKGVLPEREGRAHGTPAERCILDVERRDARIRRILFVVPLLPFEGENIPRYAFPGVSIRTFPMHSLLSIS